MIIVHAPAPVCTEFSRGWNLSVTELKPATTVMDMVIVKTISDCLRETAMYYPQVFGMCLSIFYECVFDDASLVWLF